MGENILFVCSVGTSVERNLTEINSSIAPKKQIDFKSMSEEEIVGLIQKEGEYLLGNWEGIINFTYKGKLPSAEIQPLYLYAKDYLKEVKEEDSWDVLLIVTNNESKKHAKTIGAIINKLYELSDKNNGLWRFKAVEFDEIENYKNLNIDAKNRDTITKGLKTLYEYLQNILKFAVKKGYTEVIFNPTGSYKFITAYLNMFAFMSGKPTLYSNENSDPPNVLILPVFPINFDIASIDEYISIIKGEFSTKNLKGYPPFIRTLFEKEEGSDYYKIGPWGKIVLEEYEKAKGFNIGYGKDLIEKLNEKLEEEFTHAIKEKWIHIWIGDQIPETVEHSIKHSKRLLEFTINLLNVLGTSSKLAELLFEEKVLSLFIGSVYLHDIGHTIINYEGSSFPIPLFPSIVRELHSFFSEYLIKRNDYEILKDVSIENWQKKAISLISRYHRSFMPLHEGKTANLKPHIKSAGKIIFDENFKEMLIPLEEEIDKDRELSPYKEKIIFTAALLSFVDATDIQSDRVVSDGFWEMREKRTKEEIEYIKKNIERLITQRNKKEDDILAIWEKIRVYSPDKEGINNMNFYNLYEKIFDTYIRLRDLYKENIPFIDVYLLGLFNKYVFKIEQFKHFHIHSKIGTILPSYKADNKIIIKIIKKEGVDDESISLVKESIEKEFNRVKDILEKVFSIEMEGENEN